jgi:4-nitrophenyl phosphatase
MDFADIQAVIMDMDGVLWRGDEPLPGLIEWFKLLRGRNLKFALASNNGGKSPDDYVRKLAKLGVPDIRHHQVVTSGTVAVSYLQTQYPPGTPVHVLGGDGLREVMRAGGFTIADEGAKAVVVGLDPSLTYDRLKRAALLLRAGADFIATNVDATYPAPEGLVPGAGSIVAALRVATGREPDAIMGKPHAPMFEASLRALQTTPAQTLMIGDRLNTDIEGAVQLGLKTALVLTGVSTREEAAVSLNPPDGIFEGLPDLIRAWS